MVLDLSSDKVVSLKSLILLGETAQNYLNGAQEGFTTADAAPQFVALVCISTTTKLVVPAMLSGAWLLNGTTGISIT